MTSTQEMGVPADAPRPRLCRITKWPDFDGYGFHLQAIKSKPGQFIGKIDESSPAEAAGLRQGDRIVEVNGVNINNENHVQVVERIKANQRSVELLVIDAKCYAYYEERQLVVQSTWDNVLVIANEPRSESADSTSTSGATGSPIPSPAPSPSPNPSNASSGRMSSATREEKREKEAQAIISTEVTSVVSSAKKIDASPSSSIASSEASSLNDAPGKPRSANINNQSLDTKETQELVFEFDKLSAAEMRARLASRKRIDPRQENLSAKQKHQIIQAL